MPFDDGALCWMWRWWEGAAAAAAIVALAAVESDVIVEKGRELWNLNNIILVWCR